MMGAVAEERTLQFGLMFSSDAFQASRQGFVADAYRSMAMNRQELGLPATQYSRVGSLGNPELDLPLETFEGEKAKTLHKVWRLLKGPKQLV